MNILNLLKQIGCINAKSDGICNISSLRDKCWVKMFAEQGYTKGELIFPDGGHSSFFLVLPDGNIASADNVMCGNGFYAVANELDIDADEVLGTEPYGQFFMYEDEDGLEYEDCSISIWTPQEFMSKLKQCKQLANSSEMFNEAYDLDAEMAVWEKRANSKFGQLLKQLDNVAREEMGCELDEYGIEQSIISHYITAYSLDGNKAYTLKTIKNILGEYDLLQNKRIQNLLSQLEMSLNESKNMKGKNTIRLTESELKRIITESVKKIISERNFESDRHWEDYVPDTIEKLDFYEFATSDYLQQVLKNGNPLSKKTCQIIIQLANDDTIDYIKPFEYNVTQETVWDYPDELNNLPKQTQKEILELVEEFVGETNRFNTWSLYN